MRFGLFYEIQVPRPVSPVATRSEIPRSRGGSRTSGSRHWREAEKARK